MPSVRGGGQARPRSRKAQAASLLWQDASPAGKVSPLVKGFQKSYLRGIGQTLRPSLNVGKKGLDEAFFRELERALDQQELIKVRFAARKEEKRALASSIAEKSGATLAGLVGHTALFYREHPDAEKRQVRLPERPGGNPKHDEN